MRSLRFALPAFSTLALVGYVVVSGLRNTVLKGLQIHGAAHPIGGENPISFCNVFLLSQLIIGLTLLLGEPALVRQDLQRLDGTSRRLIVADSFLGCFLAPLAFFLALDQLTVITQSLLFSLTLPASALVAQRWLKEKLPQRFWLSMALILAGLIVGKLAGPARAMGMDQIAGFLWALVSVGATALRSSVRRQLVASDLCRGLVSGVTNLAGAAVFGLIALVRYGPQHFFYLSFWWVFWVIAIYGITLCLGTELLRQVSTRNFNVTQVAFAGSASLVVTVISAALFLKEPLTPAVLLSLSLILAGVAQRFLAPSPVPAETSMGSQ